MTKDLTTGSPLPLILKFSIPLLLGNIFQQFYNLVDTIIVGKFLGINALSSVGATASVSYLLVGFCTACCGGFAIPIAQQFGAKAYGKMRSYVMNCIYLSIIFVIIITAATVLLCDDILTWMKTPADIFDGAYAYLVVILAGIPFTFLYNMVAGIIRAIGDSKTPFYFLVLATILNIILDLVFIVVFDMGVAGAAYATIISQAVAGILCVIYMRKNFDILRFTGDEKQLNMQMISTLLMMGVPMGLQSSITAVGSVMLQSSVNALGTIYVSAYTAVMKLKQFSICPYSAFDTSIATYCSQNYGAKKVDRIYKGIKYGLLIYSVYSVLLTIILVFFSDKISLIFLDASETEVLGYVKEFFIYCGLFYLIIPVLNCLRSAIQGLGYSIVSMLSGLSELIARAIMALLVIPAVGYIGVCFTDGIAWVAAAFCVGILYPILMKRVKQTLKSEK